MHIAICSYPYDARFNDVDELLNAYRLMTGWAEGLVRAGASVSVFQRFKHTAQRQRNGVNYFFVADALRPAPKLYEIPFGLHRHVCAAQPDLVHVDGLIFPLQLLALRAQLKKHTPIVAQHHGEMPQRSWRGLAQAIGLRAASGFLFTHRGIAHKWQQRKHIQPRQKIYEVCEGSTDFQLGDKHQARTRTGLRGDPVLLWVGRLDWNKDPLTILDGFSHFLAHKPNAKLYMAYNDNLLQVAIQTHLLFMPKLRESVTLLGAVPHADMENFYRAADYFVLGSHHEGSGVALLEALACGCTPVVSDIPAHQAITAGGRVGKLWQTGEASAFAQALLEAEDQGLSTKSTLVRKHFDQQLTFEAIGQKAFVYYEQALEAKRTKPAFLRLKKSGGTAWR